MRAVRDHDLSDVLDRLQRRRLRRYVCGLCEMPLDRAFCSAFGEKCSEEVRAARRADCLKAYRPWNRTLAVASCRART